MGIDDPKPVLTDFSNVKLPPMDKPGWFKDVEEKLLREVPPAVGPQDSWLNVIYHPKIQHGSVCFQTCTLHTAAAHKGGCQGSHHLFLLKFGQNNMLSKHGHR